MYINLYYPPFTFGRQGPVLRRWTHGRKIVGSIPGLVNVCVCVSLIKTLYVTLFQSTKLKMSTSKSWGVNLAVPTSYPGGSIAP